MEIQPYETDIFYDKYGLRLWEKRHAKVLSLISETKGLKKAITLVFRKINLFAKISSCLTLDVTLGNF